MKESEPLMTCYKLVTCEFKWFGLQGRVEKLIQSVRVVARVAKFHCFSAVGPQAVLPIPPPALLHDR